MTTDVAVIGAGAIGLSVAWELASRGCSVTVIERDRIRRPEDASGSSDAASAARTATSWAAAGILPPANVRASSDPIDRLRGLSHELFPQWAARLVEETGVDPQLDRCGGWYLSDTIGEAASMAGMVAYWRDLEVECEEAGTAELVRQEPFLADWVASRESGECQGPPPRAWWVPDEYQIRTPRYLDALVQGCLNQGVRLLDEKDVVDLQEDAAGAAVSIRESTGQTSTVAADRVAVCGGVWSGRLADRLRLSGSLVPVRGQVLLLKTEQRLLHSVINLGQRYLVPRRDGSVLVGSCEEEVGFQHGTTPKALAELRTFARDLCPSLADSGRELMAWSGLRPLTFDGVPMCGKLPGSQRLFVATGHFRSGIHLSPGTAVCMADLINGQSPPIDVDFFRVGKQQAAGDPTGESSAFFNRV